jgi:hypothetical protein
MCNKFINVQSLYLSYLTLAPSPKEREIDHCSVTFSLLPNLFPRVLRLLLRALLPVPRRVWLPVVSI